MDGTYLCVMEVDLKVVSTQACVATWQRDMGQGQELYIQFPFKPCYLALMWPSGFNW